MFRSSLYALLFALLASSAWAEDYLLPEYCTVNLVDDLKLHATEAGILDRLTVKEGSQVRSEDILAQIDAREAEKALVVAKYALHKALEQANNDIEVQYSKAAAAVAAEEVGGLEDTNAKVPGAVTESDLRQARLDHRRSKLAIEKAQHDLKLFGLEAWTKKAEVEAADMAIERRTLRAPFDGQVIKVVKQEKEWVNPGDPILRIVRMDQLQVDGLVPISEYAPADLAGCEVSVEGKLGDRTVKSTGRIVFVNPILVRGERVIVRAEIANREERGHWVLLPEMNVTMTIHLGTGETAVGEREETIR